ncbi:uracil-DNA glycosylase family 4 [Candidatus Pelagibacter ubique]|uniref:Type-5 uracil-DNA glycosylase n=1 Tax=Pelagibacter ubique TaxID=198252 RepID=A0ABX1T522_PELUQ|nr:uracil-DNA glycosylase [Candidatus Pelagibacter ubique]NMN68129.1 uracil-DNA glycosylase family 4 [Candidatus Pelagibacter ubique]
MTLKFKKLNNTIIKCKKCPRLIKFSKIISVKKRKHNISEVYWGKPVTGFGDINAKLMIIGLAPAAHGGTRTGRAFTGDKSGDFLFSCLYKTGISNLPTSTHIKDGLKIYSTYITNILKCVPPGDKPLKVELDNCSNYFNNEIQNLKKLKVIITLGKIAFDNCIKFYKRNFKIHQKFIFKHGARYKLPDGKFLIPCYHPSPRNVNTKVIDSKKMINLLKIAKKII